MQSHMLYKQIHVKREQQVAIFKAALTIQANFKFALS